MISALILFEVLDEGTISNFYAYNDIHYRKISKHTLTA